MRQISINDNLVRLDISVSMNISLGHGGLTLREHLLTHKAIKEQKTR